MAWYEARKGGGTGADQLAIMGSGTTFDFSELQTHTSTIPQYSFTSSAIRDIVSPYVTSVEANAFQKAVSVRNISLPNCTVINASAFTCNRPITASSASSLAVSINLPSVVQIKENGFYGFGGKDTTAELEFPACTTLGNQAFRATSASAFVVKSLSFPVVETLGTSVFVSIVAETLDIGATCTSMGTTPLASATITNLIVRATTPPTLGTNAGLGNGANITHIYVPASSVSDYTDSTNYPRWAAYESIISAIPE